MSFVDKTAKAVIEKIGEIGWSVLESITGAIANGIVTIIPDLVGYTAIVAGGLVMLAPYINKSPMAPISVLALVGIFGISIVGGV